MRLLGLRQNISNVPFRTIQEDYDKAEDTLLLNIQKWTYIEQYLNTPGATLDMVRACCKRVP